MLYLVFLVLMVIILISAIQGKFLDTLCNVALVIGCIGSAIGLIVAFFTKNSGISALLNVAVLFIAFALKPAAKQFVKLREDKIAAIEEKINEDMARRFPGDDKPPVYNDDNFDDPKIRFGGGDGGAWNGR